MAVKDAFVAELKYEAGLTRKMLEKVPMDKAEWKPHEKSMTLGRLATHIAETILCRLMNLTLRQILHLKGTQLPVQKNYWRSSIII